MIKANAQDMKVNLSRYLEQVEAGEVVVIWRQNEPIAELRRIAPPRTGPRVLGAGRTLFGSWSVPASFSDPLPDDLLSEFGS